MKISHRGFAPLGLLPKSSALAQSSFIIVLTFITQKISDFHNRELYGIK
jgi:hypothetical protein